jgi:hypothetical protein
MMAGVDPVVIGVLLACLASCLFNGGIVLQALEARQVPHELGLRLSLIGRLVRRRRWLAGTALNVLALPTQTAALLLAPLTAVQPADATGLLLLLFLGSRMLGERVGRRDLAAVGALIGGIVLLTASAPKRHVAEINGLDVALPLVVVAAIAVAPLVLRGVTGVRNIIVVLGAGFAFAFTAFCTKLAADAIEKGDLARLAVAVALAGAGALAGMVSEQTALQHRPATQVAPIIFVIELLVPVALALIVVGENWGGATLPIVAAIALVVAAVVVLGRAPQVAALIGAEAESEKEPA